MAEYGYKNALESCFILTAVRMPSAWINSGCREAECYIAKMAKSVGAGGVSTELKAQDEVIAGGVLDGSIADKNDGSDFVSVIKHALENDPTIISKRRDVDAKIASIDYAEAQKFSGIKHNLRWHRGYHRQYKWDCGLAQCIETSL